ncbi:hypothetical protein EVAR_2828_1 [Eumeta japonica]|uniref:Uncharacterized protein n=1 Tax=Eumeta variegata TaxID=151549 RepID=A0A4C1T0N9_EUMVA|nr:hypothetical protein EVAR_2828_1 [Eumeta japonica]
MAADGGAARVAAGPRAAIDRRRPAPAAPRRLARLRSTIRVRNFSAKNIAYSGLFQRLAVKAHTDNVVFYSCNKRHMKPLASRSRLRRRPPSTCYFVTLASVAEFIVRMRIRAKESDIGEDFLQAIQKSWAARKPNDRRIYAGRIS